tara:strand:+ start:214 stop:1077 length:864 start_codon:yes stop_codon:yes gene_type:complete
MILMNNDATSKYTPISKVKELNKLIGDQKGLTSSDETTGVSELNRPYLYKVKNEDADITNYKFNALIKELLDKNKIQISEYHNLNVQENIDKEINLINFETFDHLWEELVIEADKQLEREYEVSKKIFEDHYKNRNNNLYFAFKPHRSLNIHLKQKLSIEDAELISIISECVGKQYSVDGIKFSNRREYVLLFNHSRNAFNKLKENKINIYGGSKNFLTPFDYGFNESRISQNNFINLFIQHRSFNFLNFGVEENIVTIPNRIGQEKDLYEQAYKKIDTYLKNCKIS